jgi:hypothetical protein
MSGEAVMVPIKAVLVVGATAGIGGAFAGFSLAERIYASEEQKSGVRTLATVSVAAVLVTAAAGAISVMRARAA